MLIQSTAYHQMVLRAESSEVSITIPYQQRHAEFSPLTQWQRAGYAYREAPPEYIADRAGALEVLEYGR